MAKQSSPINWISEREAAELVGLKPLYFRRKVVYDQEMQIGYTRPSRSRYEYNAADIEAHKMQTAFLPNRA